MNRAHLCPAALSLSLSLIVSTPLQAQDEAEVEQRDDFNGDEQGVGEHPTAGRFTFAGRVGWTSNVGSTASVDPFRVFPPEDDPFAVDGPITPLDFEADLRLQSEKVPDVNPLGLKIGAQGGFTLADDLLYIGAAVHYFVGDDEVGVIPGPVESSTIESSTKVNIVTVGLELGIDAAVSPAMVIRPLLGFGASVGLSEVCVDGVCESGSQMQIYLSPALGLIGFITDDVFVGGEVGMTGVSGPSRIIGADFVLTSGVAL